MSRQRWVIDTYAKDIKAVTDTMLNGATVSEDSVKYISDDEWVIIPYRIYFPVPSDDKVAQLSDRQRLILHCICTRNPDGYLRERCVSEILKDDYPSWCIPFVVKLCDEYVVEILRVIYTRLNEAHPDDYVAFCSENKATIRKSYARMTSYWNEYYRDTCYRFKDYIGCQLFRECFGYDRSFEK